MPHEREDWQKLLERQHIDEVRKRRPELRVLAQAEVPAAALTRSVEWDFFLSLLQGKIEELDSSLTVLQGSLATEMVFDHGQLAANKAFAMRIKVQLDTLQSVLELPRQIIETGEKAKFELSQYDE